MAEVTDRDREMARRVYADATCQSLEWVTALDENPATDTHERVGRIAALLAAEREGREAGLVEENRKLREAVDYALAFVSEAAETSEFPHERQHYRRAAVKIRAYVTPPCVRRGRRR